MHIAFVRQINRELKDWQQIANELAAAINQLNTIYRSEYDEPGENPPWLREPLRKYNQLKKQTVAAMPNGQELSHRRTAVWRTCGLPRN